MKLFISLFAMASLGLVAPACGKKEEPKPATTEPTKAPETKPTEETKAAEADAAAPAADDAAPTAAEEVAPTAAEEVAVADDAAAAAEIKPYLKINVGHHDPAKGPVTAEFAFTVVEAHTDLTKLDTAKAVLEVDLGSITTGVPDRDTHVKSPDFLDVATSAKATITVDRIKAGTTADMYDATAKVDLHGVSKEVPVTFKVVEKKADGTIVIEGETKGLLRDDWKVGKAPAEANVAANFDVSLRAELKETGAPIVPAQGTPAELFAKMVTHQEAVLGLVEANKADADKAAEAVEKYAAEHKDELASLGAAMKAVPPDQIEATLKAAEEKVKGLTERGTKLMQENPSLMQSERFVKAMASLQGQ